MRSTRASESPSTFERICPTCIGLATFGELKSTTTEVTPGGGNESENAAANLDTEAADVPLQRTENTAKLVLVGEFPLAGTVISLARVKALNTKSKGEALLVAFLDRLQRPVRVAAAAEDLA